MYKLSKTTRTVQIGDFSMINRWNKTWILATVFSLMLYDLYWIRGVYTRIFGILFENLPDILAKHPNFYIDYVAGGIYDPLRLIAVILIFTAAYLAWGPKKQSFVAVRKLIAIPILFEALYWLGILPLNLWLISGGRSPLLLYVGFVIQIIVAAPLLLILSFKTWKFKDASRNSLVKWGCMAGAGYVFGMWINNMLRWFSMSGQLGLPDLFTGVTTLGFLNTAITLTLSLVFAIVGSFIFVGKNNRKLAIRLLGLAVLLFGLYFAFYVVYSWFAPGAWRFVLLTEIWPIPLTGLGAGMLKGEV